MEPEIHTERQFHTSLCVLLPSLQQSSVDDLLHHSGWQVSDSCMSCQAHQQLGGGGLCDCVILDS